MKKIIIIESIILSISVFIIMILSAILINRQIVIVQERKEIKEAEETIQKYEDKIKESEEVIQKYEENKKNVKDYYKKLGILTQEILSGSAIAENCGNKVIDVWHNAIWQVNDSETDQYTCIDGKFVGDFNIALDNLYTAPEFVTQIEKIKNNQEDVLSQMRELNNPPDECRTAYELLIKYYETYMTFTDLVINCQGSLETFSNDFVKNDDELIKYYKDMQIFIEG